MVDRKYQHNISTKRARSLRYWIFILPMAALIGAMLYYFYPKGAAPVAANAPATSPAPADFPKGLAGRLQALGSRFDGEVGIAVQSITDGRTVHFNGERPFPQQSVSKLWVAATVLDKVDAGEISLNESITLTAADLTIFHQPIRKRIGNGATRATVSELLFLAMTQSDNTANDVLFRRVGGKAGVERFLLNKGISGIAMSSGEKDLQMQIAGMQWDPRFSYGRTFWYVRETVPFEERARAIAAYVDNPADGAAPIGIAQALSRLHKRELLSAQSTAYLIDLMNQSKTGPDRLRGGLSPGWSIAHKTGTGQVLKLLATAYNDVGILTSPQGRSYAVIVMIGSTNRPVPERQALMHGVMQAAIQCDALGWEQC